MFGSSLWTNQNPILVLGVFYFTFSYEEILGYSLWTSQNLILVLGIFYIYIFILGNTNEAIHQAADNI